MSAPERRHETTVGSVTAYASAWSLTPAGHDICTIGSNGRSSLDVRVIRPNGHLLLSDDAICPTEALVLAKVLQEAAELAQGGEVER